MEFVCVGERGVCVCEASRARRTKMECCPPKYLTRLNACSVFTMSSVLNFVLSDSSCIEMGGESGEWRE